MKHSDALSIAKHLITRLAPYCQRIEIAGSVRRQKPEVKDIELVAEPLLTPVVDMFGPTGVLHNPFTNYSWDALGQIIKNGDRYKQIDLPTGIKLDLFIVLPPAFWSTIYTLRTGSPEFSHWLVTRRNMGGALPSDCRVEDGRVLRGGEQHYDVVSDKHYWTGGDLVDIHEEADFLAFCGLPWIDPCNRYGPRRDLLRATR